MSDTESDRYHKQAINRRERSDSKLAAMLALSYGLTGFPRNDPLEGIDIDKEFEMIQQKRSKLSASLRRLVVHRKKN